MINQTIKTTDNSNNNNNKKPTSTFYSSKPKAFPLFTLNWGPWTEEPCYQEEDYSLFSTR
jgi:hypothetical protein